MSDRENEQERSLTSPSGQEVIELLNRLPLVAGIFEIDGTIAWLSDGIESILGYRSADIVGTTGFMELIEPSSIESIQTQLSRSMAGEEGPCLEVRMMHRDGSIRTLLVVGAIRNESEKPAGLVSLGIDITHLEELREAISFGDSLKAALMGVLPDLIILVDQEDQFIEAHAGQGTTMDRPARDLVGKKPHDLPPDVGQQTSEALQKVRDGAGPITFECLWRREGDDQYLDVRAIRINSEFSLLVVRDITKEWLLRQKIAHREQMATIGSLSAGLVHEICNPLTAVMGNIAYLRDLVDELPDEKRKEFLEVMGDLEIGTEQMRQVTRDLKGLATTGDGSQATVELAVAVSRALKLAATSAEKGIRFEKKLEDGLTVAGDPHRVVQVILNLLLNACQSVQLARALPSKITIEAYATASQIVLEVSDRGKGIAVEDLPRVFDPFFTTRIHDGGMGLGLSVSIEIMRALGGDIEVESELGQGAKFLLRFPAESVRK